MEPDKYKEDIARIRALLYEGSDEVADEIYDRIVSNFHYDEKKKAIELALDEVILEHEEYISTTGTLFMNLDKKLLKFLNLRENHLPYHAIYHKYSYPLLQLLISQGVNINIRYFGTSLVYAATCLGKIHEVRLLIENGAFLEFGYELDTPLKQATRIGNLELVKLLIAGGADVQSSYQGFTAADIAIDCKNPDILKALISAGTKVNLPYQYEKKGLMSKSEQEGLEFIKFLVSCGADVNAFNHYHDTMINIACKKGELKVIKFLIENKANLDIPNYQQKTPLYNSLVRGNVEIAKLLIENGANVNCRDLQGMTPLHKIIENSWIADSENDISLIHLLISKGADVNIPDNVGITPLFRAVHSYYDANIICKILLSYGADVNATTIYRESILERILLMQKVEITKLLLKHGVDIPEHWAEYEMLTTVLAELVTSIDADIFNKVTLDEEDIISLKFLKKYQEREDVLTRFGRDFASNKCYEVFDEMDRTCIMKFDEANLDHVKFILENYDNKYVKAILGEALFDYASRSVSLFEREMCAQDLYQEFVSTGGKFYDLLEHFTSREQKESLINLYKIVLNRGNLFYSKGNFLLNSASILFELTKDCLSEHHIGVYAIKLLIENGHAQYVAQKLYAREINAVHVMKAVSLFYATQPCYKAHETYEAIAPVAEYFLERINSTYSDSDEIKFILAAYLLHNENYELLEELTDKEILDLNNSSKQMSLLSKMLMERNIDAAKYLLQKEDVLFYNPDDEHDNVIERSAIIASKEILEFAVLKYCINSFDAALEFFDLSGDDLLEYAISCAKTNQSKKSDVKSYAEYLKDLGLTVAAESYEAIEALPDDPVIVPIFEDKIEVVGAGTFAGAGAGSGSSEV